MRLPKRHSFSRLDTFTSICERRYAWDALEGEFTTTAAIRRGHHVHAAVEAVLNRVSKGEELSAALESVGEEPPDGSLSGDILGDYLRRLAPALEHITPYRDGLELWFRQVKRLPIVGKIDITSSTCPIFNSSGQPTHSIEAPTVLDLKTTGNPSRIKTEIETRNSLQLQIYCLAMGYRHAGFLWVLPSGPPRGRTVMFTDKELERARKWLTSTVGTVELKWELSEADHGGPKSKGRDLRVFSLASPGHPLCSEKYCDFWNKCLGAETDGECY